jgi:hypothetical protein
MRSGAAPGAGYFGLVLSVTVPSQARKATVCWTRNEREVHPHGARHGSSSPCGSRMRVAV